MAAKKQNQLKKGYFWSIWMELESTRNGGEERGVFLCVHFQEGFDHNPNSLCPWSDISKPHLQAVVLLQTSASYLEYK